MIKLIKNKDINDVLEFLIRNENDFFKPHDYTKETLINNVESDDKFYIMSFNNTIIAYGMLRGYQEGYKIPSLGILIGEDYRGKGYSKTMMRFLENEASKTSDEIRLTVFKKNITAISLYKKMGYVLENYNDDSLLGLKKIK